MKKIQSILLSILLLLPLWLANNVYSNSNEEVLISTSEKLLLIKKGSLYIKVIDNFIEKKKEDTSKLETLQSKLVVIQNKLENKNDKNSITLKAILNYLDAKINIVLTKDIIEKIIIVNNNYYKAITYPGFSDSYSEYDKTILA
jgi:hypothetical protein